MDKETAIDAQGVTKEYKGANGKKALKGVTFQISKGEVFSLLGRNGAGKTTFVRIASGQLTPTSGTVKIGGLDIVSQVEGARELVAVVPQEARVINSSTAKDFVKLYLTLRGVGLGDADSQALEGLRQVGLLEQAGESCNALSGGNRHKLILACVIASKAPILFLDEPTIGLDAQSRRGLWNTILKVKKEGRTVLLTTHYIDEAEVLSDRVAIIKEGKVVKVGTPKSIVREAGFDLRLDVDAADLKKLKIPAGVDVNQFGGKKRLLGKKAEIEGVAARAIKENVPVSVAKANLEDAFIKLVGGGVE